tara:strand:+ start:2405 stop:3802 length:1398 start_codon:yes stop_codon:yes gene_type:complete
MIDKEHKKLLHDVNQKLMDYLDNIDLKSISTADEIRADIDLNLGPSSNFDIIRDSIDKYLFHSTKTASPAFFNQLYGGFSITGHIGEILTSITNNSMYTYEMSPVATLIETEVIGKMCSLVGYQKGGGIFVTGGSNGNFLAMLAARHKKLPDAMSKGIFGASRLTAFVSKDSHYSIPKAAVQLGLGTDGIVYVDVDNDGRMIPSDLERLVLKSIENNELPFFVGATAGTTVRGSFDPITPIHQICKKYNLWLHVDASWGGSALLSSKHKYLLKGSELSDSLSWCAHKAMAQPLICTVALFSDPTILREINSIDGTDYLFHGEKLQEKDIGEFSLQCGRRVDALKLWLTWKYLGDEGFEHNISNLVNLISYAQEKVEISDNLVLISTSNYLNLCFQVCPKGLDRDKANTFTKKVRDSLLQEGKAMVNYAQIDDKTCIRLVLANYSLTETEIDTFFDNIEDIITGFQ